VSCKKYAHSSLVKYAPVKYATLVFIEKFNGVNLAVTDVNFTPME